MKIQKLIIAVLALCTFGSCDTDYPKVTEYIEIENNSNRTIEVTIQLTTLSDSIASCKLYPYQGTYLVVDRNAYDLWLSESQFEAQISGLKIFAIESGDTTYVNPLHYNKIGLWKNSYSKDMWVEGYPYANEHLFEVTEEMFYN